MSPTHSKLCAEQKLLEQARVPRAGCAVAATAAASAREAVDVPTRSLVRILNHDGP
jgi:hypothetical protein